MIFILILLILCALYSVKVNQRGGAPFSELDKYVGKGVPGSYANIKNGPDPTKQQFKVVKHKNPLPTYYGHGIPLKTQKPGAFWGEPITPHHTNPICSLKCCPSPYSCDHGCLCVDQKGFRNKIWGK